MVTRTRKLRRGNGTWIPARPWYGWLAYILVPGMLLLILPTLARLGWFDAIRIYAMWVGSLVAFYFQGKGERGLEIGEELRKFRKFASGGRFPPSESAGEALRRRQKERSLH